MKKKHKYTVKELAELCGKHFDTLYKAKRLRYCTFQLAGLLEQTTGIPRSEWLLPDNAKNGDPWKRVLK